MRQRTNERKRSEEDAVLTRSERFHTATLSK